MLVRAAASTAACEFAVNDNSRDTANAVVPFGDCQASLKIMRVTEIQADGCRQELVQGLSM